MTSSSLLPLTEATNLLPRRNGKKVHVKTLYRWIRTGCRGVRLTAVKNGDVWFTSAEWLIEFQRQCSQGVNGASLANAATATAQMARRILEQRYGFHAKEEEGKESKAQGRVHRVRSAHGN